ncbi:MAG: serine/threonine-protein kinase [Chitinophagaceae bacterium]
MAKVFTIAEGLENMGALKTGGQGSVYKAVRVKEVVTAVKILPTPIHNETPEDKHFVAFQNEVNKLKKVAETPNPNIVKILSSGFTESGNFPFIEMEFIEGPDLEELLKPPHDPIFSVKECVKVAEQLSCALAHCHKADVKHGDVKSNNVKFNTHTGNYVLLDFGLALTTDEERRSSLRHAGAIEFMAPEQSEGKMLLETDVYSFGVVLYEVVAGIVPFPLKDSGETARNQVMVAHLETAPPDVLQLRKDALPQSWSLEKKEREMQVPQWLITTINKCLQKKPANRFANGMELHDFIAAKTIDGTTFNNQPADLNKLQQEYQQLMVEKESLQQQLTRSKFPLKPNEESSLKPSAPKRKWALPAFVLLLLAGLGVSSYLLLTNNAKKKNETEAAAEPLPKPRRSIGQYKVIASRAFFHNEPKETSRRSAYMVPSSDVVNALEEENGFVYTEFTNNKGQVSKGWISKQDLVPLDELINKPKTEKKEQKLTPEDINLQLGDARKLLENNQVPEALYIYNFLADQDVPEALFQCGNLALQKKNDNLDCIKGMEWVKKASDKGYAPATRTLGFLYIFADNKEVLQLNDYEQCTYERNVYKGTRLLMEAILSGDTTARKIMDQLKDLKQSTKTVQ